MLFEPGERRPLIADFVTTTYFFLLFVIAFYGVHIYWLIWLYLRNPAEKGKIGGLLAPLSRITIQLPVYNERAVVLRLIRSVAALDWPKDLLDIQILDDSVDSTSDLAASETARLRALGYQINHIRRKDRSGYKAGALAHGLKSAAGEFVAVFDADNVPRPDFLKRIIHHFADPRVGLVQARWSFMNREESLLCRAQALFLDAHFFVEQSARCRGRLFMNFNGTAGVWRRQAIDAAGGWQADTLTEDLDLSFRAQMAGWRFVFAEDVDVPTELPGSIRAFKTQQFRWAKGAFETGLKLIPSILRSDLPMRIKIASSFHLTQKIISVAILFLSIMLIPALFFRLETGMFKVLAIDLPIFLAATGSMSMFYGLAHRRERTDRSWRSTLLLPVLTSIGIGLAVNNTFAIYSALFGRRNHFVRTPKSGSTDCHVTTPPTDYRVGYDYSGKLEGLLALYAVGAVVCAISLNLFFSIPFLMTFVFGYMYFSVLSWRERHA
jgi:cellulose synthase/poly-beta-1,6-N-acetylglucosamine synthase-like glycosyltransferase